MSTDPDARLAFEPLIRHLAQGVTVMLGDCMDYLPLACDAVISDPPYGIRHKTAHGASWEGKEIANDHSTEARDRVWSMYQDKPRAMFGMSWKAPPPPGVRGTLIWDKGHSGSGDLAFPWKPSWEEIYIAGFGWAGSRDPGVLRGQTMLTWESGPAHDGNGRQHPHQKPTWIAERLLAKLPGVTTVLDPFMGSGTTGIACIHARKAFVGIEVDPGYFEIACERLTNELRQGRLF